MGVDLTYEYGKIFGSQSFCYGIQLKVGNISGRSGAPNTEIKALIGQLAVAFGRDKFGLGEGRRLDGVFVITTGEINAFARAMINDARIGFRQVYFIDQVET